MIDRFRLVDLPHPPSIHDQYQAIRMGNAARIVPTHALTKFQKSCEEYGKRNFLIIGKARAVCREWMLKGLVIRTDFFFFAHGTRIWTQKDEPRRYDASNLVKSIEDELAKLLMIDDKYFFKGAHEKAETNRDAPFVNLMLKPWKPRSFAEIKEQEGF